MGSTNSRNVKIHAYDKKKNLNSNFFSKKRVHGMTSNKIHSLNISRNRHFMNKKLNNS